MLHRYETPLKDGPIPLILAYSAGFYQAVLVLFSILLGMASTEVLLFRLRTIDTPESGLLPGWAMMSSPV